MNIYNKHVNLWLTMHGLVDNEEQYFQNNAWLYVGINDIRRLKTKKIP